MEERDIQRLIGFALVAGMIILNVILFWIGYDQLDNVSWQLGWLTGICVMLGLHLMR